MYLDGNQQLFRGLIRTEMEGCVLICRACFAQQALSGIPGSIADRLTV